MRLPNTRDEVIGNILTYDEAIRNISRYSADVQSVLLQTMTRALGWVIILHNGEYRAAPLKFAGAEINMTPERYKAKQRELGGTSASNRIGEIFFDEDDWEDHEIEGKHKAIRALRALARQHGKELKSSTRFYLLPGENIDDTERAKVDRILQQVARENLSAKAHQALVIRLTA